MYTTIVPKQNTEHGNEMCLELDSCLDTCLHTILVKLRLTSVRGCTHPRTTHVNYDSDDEIFVVLEEAQQSDSDGFMPIGPKRAVIARSEPDIWSRRRGT